MHPRPFCSPVSMKRRWRSRLVTHRATRQPHCTVEGRWEIRTGQGRTGQDRQGRAGQGRVQCQPQDPDFKPCQCLTCISFLTNHTWIGIIISQATIPPVPRQLSSPDASAAVAAGPAGCVRAAWGSGLSASPTCSPCTKQHSTAQRSTAPGREIEGQTTEQAGRVACTHADMHACLRTRMQCWPSRLAGAPWWVEKDAVVPSTCSRGTTFLQL